MQGSGFRTPCLEWLLLIGSSEEDFQQNNEADQFYTVLLCGSQLKPQSKNKIKTTPTKGQVGESLTCSVAGYFTNSWFILYIKPNTRPKAIVMVQDTTTNLRHYHYISILFQVTNVHDHSLIKLTVCKGFLQSTLQRVYTWCEKSFITNPTILHCRIVPSK